MDFDANRIVSDLRTMSLHPDGPQLTYTFGKNRSEIWALESFLPFATGRP
jgi:hypothetical protein